MENQFKVGGSVVKLVKGDITDVSADAIVNAANSSLMGGGGVDGAIHRKGGLEILEECRRIRVQSYPNGLPTGKAVIANAGKLPAKKVIHAVGPVWHGGNHGEPELLAHCYENSLDIALENKLKTIAFPSISTGAYRYPIRDASRIALETIKKWLEEKQGIKEVIFVLFSIDDLEIYEDTASEVFRRSK
jgi:O-acetyl-ADP-ribose deacetylase (regulator of RNase III)